jgi:tripartite ATP-independent transporter DctP family solute receptor
MKKQTLAFVCAVIVSIVVLTACSSATPAPAVVDARVFKLGLTNDEQSTWYAQAAKFAEAVKVRSGGKLAISVFANSSLAGGDQVKELGMVQQGTIDFHIGGNIVYTNIDPRYTVAMMPWLFTNNQEADAVRTSALGKELLTFSESKGIVGLCLAENGFRQLSNSKKEVKTPDDLKGLKIRVPPTKLYQSVFEKMGATSVAIDLPKLFDALRDGSADGQENAVDTFATRQFYNVQKYMTLWNYSYGYLILGVNKSLWDTFDPATQTMIRQAADESCTYQVDEYRKLIDSQIQLTKSKGTAVITLTPEQIKAFRDKSASLYTEYEATVGKDLLNKWVNRK